MKPSEQKFRRGDLVRIADDLGPYKRWFPAGCDAIVLGSYADSFGGNDRSNFEVLIRGEGPVSWYSSADLTLIEAGKVDLIDEWLDAMEGDDQ